MNKNPSREHRRERFLDLSREDSSIRPGRLDLTAEPQQEAAISHPQVWAAEHMQRRIEALRDTSKAASDSDESQAA